MLAHVFVNPMPCTTSSALADPVHRSASSTAPNTIVPLIEPSSDLPLTVIVTALQHVRNFSGKPGAKRLRLPLPWLEAMKRFWLDMNPTVRGFLIILAITGVVVALSLYSTLAALYAIARIAFFIAIAVFLFLVWRGRRPSSTALRS